MSKPQSDSNLICPLRKKVMKKVCHTCPWWIQVRGRHPQTGEELDRWECAVAFAPLATLEVAKEARQGAAATESFRNNVHAYRQQDHAERQRTQHHAITQRPAQKLIDG